MSFQVIQAVSMSENAAPATCPCPGTSMKDSNGSLNHLEHPIYQMIEECLQKVEAIEKKKKKRQRQKFLQFADFFVLCFFTWCSKSTIDVISWEISWNWDWLDGNLN